MLSEKIFFYSKIRKISFEKNRLVNTGCNISICFCCIELAVAWAIANKKYSCLNFLRQESQYKKEYFSTTND
ncbi:hypothetical protein TXIAM_190180 [Tenacibaculum xiamenense]